MKEKRTVCKNALLYATNTCLSCFISTLQEELCETDGDIDRFSHNAALYCLQIYSFFEWNETRQCRYDSEPLFMNQEMKYLPSHVRYITHLICIHGTVDLNLISKLDEIKI